jgi:hypothetical protein
LKRKRVHQRNEEADEFHDIYLYIAIAREKLAVPLPGYS